MPFKFILFNYLLFIYIIKNQWKTTSELGSKTWTGIVSSRWRIANAQFLVICCSCKPGFGMEWKQDWFSMLDRLHFFHVSSSLGQYMSNILSILLIKDLSIETWKQFLVIYVLRQFYSFSGLCFPIELPCFMVYKTKLISS